MKLFHYTGMASAALLAVAAFIPWVYIAPVHAAYSGMDTGASNFGKPGVLNILFAVLFLVFTLTPKIWAKRVNLFIAAAVIAWNLRNYLIISRCEMGYCPDKQAGLYLTVFFSIVMLVAACIPYIPPPQSK